jgi:hypothetical protein
VNTRRNFLLLALAAGAYCASAIGTPALGQTNPWKPNRPVTLIVPYSAGGSTDAIARVVGKNLTAALGQPVIIENVPGADGLIGTRRVMDANPDGYTLLLQVPAITITKYLPNLKGIDPLAQLSPVSIVAETPTLIVGSGKLPVQNFKEFVQYCKTAAEPCSIGSGEAIGRIRAKQLATEADIPNLISVNYRGTSQAMNDVIGGRIGVTFVNIPGVLSHYKNERQDPGCSGYKEIFDPSQYTYDSRIRIPAAPGGNLVWAIRPTRHAACDAKWHGKCAANDPECRIAAHCRCLGSHLSLEFSGRICSANQAGGPHLGRTCQALPLRLTSVTPLQGGWRLT